MNTRSWLIIAGGAAAGTVAWWYLGDDEEGGVLGDLRQAIGSALDLVTRGARLTHAPYDTATGVVPGTPQELADAAGLDLETYSLARAISSEEGRSDNATKAAVGWALKNLANRGGRSITAMLTRATEPRHAGFYGTQKNIDHQSASYGRSDRRASTALDPYEGDGQIAYAIQTGALPDPTDGAIEFDRPAGDDNPEQVAANRAAEGLVLAEVPDVSSGLRFWRPA